MIEIYTDGACSGNPGPGGWAAILIYKDKEKQISGKEAQTTNNRMELLATIKALELIKKPLPIRVTTDSQYVQKGITEWIERWKCNQWMTQAKPRKQIKNVDLWRRLDELNDKLEVEWHWVRGHSGDIYNEKADKLARQMCGT